MVKKEKRKMEVYYYKGGDINVEKTLYETLVQKLGNYYLNDIE